MPQLSPVPDCVRQGPERSPTASRPRDFIPLLVDLFMEGRFPLDRLITEYPFADINRAAEDAISRAAIKPVLRLLH